MYHNGEKSDGTKVCKAAFQIREFARCKAAFQIREFARCKAAFQIHEFARCVNLQGARQPFKSRQVEGWKQFPFRSKFASISNGTRQ
jgi:hypothetical protein